MIHVKKDLVYLDYFSGFEDVIAIEAILKGTSKGELYLDSKENPQVLVIWNGFDGFYAVLEEEYVSMVYDFILRTVQSSEYEDFVVYLDSKLDGIKEKIIPANNLESLEVLYYTGDILQNNVKADHQILDISSVDLSLLDSFEDIREVIESTWQDYNTFIAHGHGFVSIKDHVVTGYCISEHVTESALEFSIEVHEKHHRKGIGYGLGRAMLERCFSENKKPAWYCTDDNSGSMSLAEKLGLKLISKFHVWYFNKSDLIGG
ncbi:GNAT family N-acetyltransferase [Acidaminobacter sp. JC074]|uniref:GNAT family N-acetyltransferase n=1 Tax=Acidaminobacter sp. JC074 TaxID=2530199 RepID=UPI001F10804C|nr:GNAT family N-acetyltransferase [Acidaminobacter sp. JC074]MCH4886208.1 GNAT family N-acetyltransferase [Acidaminobacter sp. JC074]